LVLLAGAISPANAGEEPTQVPRFQHTFDSPETLAAEVLRALEAEDLQRLEQLPLSRNEFEAHVWPELPASRPERNVPVDYVWGQLAQRSRGALQRVFATHKDKHYTVVEVVYDGETTEYESFVVRREARILARDASGKNVRLALFGSILEDAGRFKLFSYVYR
jgi:hypothetical protein